MELRGSRIKLSPFDSSDRQLFIEISMCPIMMEHVYEPLTYQEAVAAFELKSQSWQFESDHWLSFGIEDISSGEKLGSIGLKVINHKARIAEVGYMIKQSAQGRGIAGEALTLIKQFGFNELKLNKLIATCSVHNIGSFRLLEKQGFSREGCLKQNALINNQFIDDYVYGLCQSDVSD